MTAPPVRLSILISVCLLTCLGPLAIQAQTTPCIEEAGQQPAEDSACAPDAVELAPLNVTTVKGQQLRATASDSVLIREVDGADPLPHLAALLNTVPGVSIQRGSGQEYLPAIRSPVLTGPGACAGFLMAEDGIPLRASGFCNLNELFDAHAEAAAQIDVIRGPAGIVHGSNALHGLINVMTAQPLPGVEQTRVSTQFSAGSDGFLKAHGRLETSTEHHALGVHLTALADAGFRDQSPVAQHKLSVRGESGADRTHWSYGLTFSELNQETAGFLTGADAYRDRAGLRDNENPEAFRDARAMRAWLRVNNSPDQAEVLPLQWSQTMYVRHNRMDFLQHFLPGDPLESNGHDSLGFQSRLEGSFKPSLSWQVGTELEWTRGRLTETQNQPVMGSAFLQETIPVGQHYDYRVDASNTGLFARLYHDNRRGPDWSAGIRLDHIRYDYDNRMLSGRTRDDGTACGFGGCRFSRPDDRSDHFSALSIDLGLHGQIDNRQHWHARLSRAFRAPQATELYRLQRDQQVADLDSEQLINLEAGLKSSASSLNWSVVAYLQRKRNSIFRDSDFFNRSDGRTRHRGIEMDLSIRMTPSWTLEAAWTFSRHQYARNQRLGDIDINGNRVDTAPSRFGHIALNWQPHDDWSARLMLQSMGSYWTDPENLHRYPGHEVLDASLTYRASPRLTLRLDLNNVLDERYADRADFTSFSGERYFPGRPRHGYVGVHYRW